MARWLFRLFAISCILLTRTPGGRAAEEWADPNLKVTSGLELWLDASRLPAAAHAFRQAGVNNRDSVETWFDGSGHRRHARQVQPAFRPMYRADLVSSRPGQAALVFDGLDDRMQISGVGKDLQNVTIFIIGSPRTMAGNFSAFLSFGSNGKNDYETGINIDVGHEIRRRFDRLNVEGKGFGGEGNLMSEDLGLGTFPVLTVTSTPGKEGTRLYVDGKRSSQRDRGAGALRMDEIRVGSRYYIYNSPAAIEQGFFHGAIAEVLIYGRLLSDHERTQVEDYLKNKYAGLRGLKSLDAQIPIRLLQPGFTVRELPVHLTNINAVNYSPDGRLFALGYDGRIHVLRDTDGDGLEDQAEVFWDQPTLRTPLAMAWRPEGLYVVSNGKISLFREGADKKVTEEVVVSGWAHDDGTTGGGVDALGLAFDKENNLFFGLGCADYTNAYRVKDGKAHYDLRSERGTILMVSPDRKNRSIVCTGIRFPVGLAFNKLGDLFCTDQEGETWLPGGNPQDKLNHIVRGKHYGFPPLSPDVRHKLDFANQIGDIYDESPVVAFSPQHQSSCGLVFNEAAKGRPAFGPSFWEDDALVAGFSRGKIWRVRLVKSAAGYVGQPTLIAACQMLTLNLAISPAGDLLVVCHSGLPDWGTGPSGPARLFKISYVNRSAPQPVLAWPAGPMEVRVAFDRPMGENEIDSAHAQITFGEFVRAADRFEVLKPPYKAVQEQGQYPRTNHRVVSANWLADRRTLSLRTDPPSFRATYGLTLPLRTGAGDRGSGIGGSPDTRHPTPDTRLARAEAWYSENAMDLAYTLNGVGAHWKSSQGKEEWSGWLPHLDLAVSRELTKGSAEHEKLFSLLNQPGELTLKSRIVLPSIVHKQGYFQGPKSIVLAVRSCDEFAVSNEANTQKLASDDPKEQLLLIQSDARPVVTISVKTRKEYSRHELSFQLDRKRPPSPLPLEWQMLPWVPLQPSLPTPDADATGRPNNQLAIAPELAGGDWKRGETIFFSQDANCSACHTLRGKGGKIGPDLSNLVFRDAASVLRDIVEPSIVINPDYVSFTVQLKNGRLLAGIPRADKDGAVRISDTDAKETVVRQADIESLAPNPVSVMPKGYAENLGKEKLADLLTFLTNPPPEDQPAPTQNGKQVTPPLRRRSEIEAILAEPSKAKSAQSTEGKKLRTLNVVLVAGPKDHGPGEHDYPAWQRRWKELLDKAPAVRVSSAWEWPQQGHWDLADVIVFYFWNHDWNEERYKQLDKFLAKGGGVVILHSASVADQEPEKLAQRIGLAFQPGRSKYRHGPLELKFNPKTGGEFDKPEAISAGLSKASFLDESYWPMIGDVSKVHVLATTDEEGKSWPMLWTFHPSLSGHTFKPSSRAWVTPFGDINMTGRVFGCILGHYSWTFDDPIFRIAFLRGLAWTAGCSFDRFVPLVTEGVKWQDN